MVKKYIMNGGNKKQLSFSADMFPMDNNNDNDGDKFAKCTSNMCAPNRKFSDGSCISLETLIKMAEAYNMYSKKMVLMMKSYWIKDIQY